MPRTYIRFVTENVDPHSNRRQGIFQAGRTLVDSRELRQYDLDELNALREWFGIHLRVPDRFSWSQKSRSVGKAIGGFKDTAQEYVGRMHAICRILNEHNIRTEMITTTRPGYIVFEDEHQIAAVPFAETDT